MLIDPSLVNSGWLEDLKLDKVIDSCTHGYESQGGADKLPTHHGHPDEKTMVDLEE